MNNDTGARVQTCFQEKKQLAYEQVSQAGFLTIGDKQNQSCLLNTR